MLDQQYECIHTQGSMCTNKAGIPQQCNPMYECWVMPDEATVNASQTPCERSYT